MKRLSESASSSTIYGNYYNNIVLVLINILRTYYVHGSPTQRPTLKLVSNIVARSGQLMICQTGLFGNHSTCVVAATATCIQGRHGMYCVFVCRVTSEY